MIYLVPTLSLSPVTDQTTLIEGAGFATGTDSLKIISDNIDLKTVSKLSTTTTGLVKGGVATGTPDLIDITSDAAANTFGAYGIAIASLAVDSYIAGVFVTVCESVSMKCAIEIASGGLGAEVPFHRFPFKVYWATAVGCGLLIPLILPIPIKFVAGTAISIRATDDQAQAKNYTCGVNFYTALE